MGMRNPSNVTRRRGGGETASRSPHCPAESPYIIRDMRNLPTTVRATLLATCLFGPSLLPLHSAGAADSWPLSRGDAQATGATAVTLPEPLAVRWEFAADEPIEAPPVVSGGRVFVADVAGTVYGLAADDGKEIWRVETEIGFVSGPAVDGDLLVIGDLDGQVYAIDVASGEKKWTHDTKGEISSAASFSGDMVLIPSQDGNLYGLSKADGMRVWTYETSDQIRCSPSIAGDRTFLGGCDGNLHTVDVLEGQSTADPLPLGGPTGSTPAIVGAHAFLPTMEGAVIAFDWKENRELWRHEDDERAQEYRTSAAVHNGIVVVASQNRQVDALDAETGERRWRYTLRRRADASPVIAGEDVWIASTDGRLTRLSLADGSEKWQFEIRGQFTSAPAIAGNRLYIADSRGVVRCFAAP